MWRDEALFSLLWTENISLGQSYSQDLWLVVANSVNGPHRHLHLHGVQPMPSSRYFFVSESLGTCHINLCKNNKSSTLDEFNARC